MNQLTDAQKDEIIRAASLLKLHYDTTFDEFTDETRKIWRETIGTCWQAWHIIPDICSKDYERPSVPARFLRVAATWLDVLFGRRVAT